MESVGKRSQTRAAKSKRNRKNKNLAWVNIIYIVILAAIIFGAGKLI
ncbi:MAG: hypothetical protein ACRCTZ_09480 [Sarcina sp.]